MSRVGDWLDERLGLGPVLKTIFYRHVPIGLSWWYSLGAATLFLFTLQALTGILLAMNYAPSPDHAYDSIRYITDVVPLGIIVRGLHHWGASAMVVVVLLHLVSAFVLGAFKYPRESTWLIGVLLFLITLGFGFTGYLLPWDQKAYWATTVGTNIPGTAPIIGPWLVKLMRGGAELGAVTLTHFYTLHVLVLPASAGLLILLHLALVIWHGVSVPPGLWFRGMRRKLGLLPVDETIAPALDPLEDPNSFNRPLYKSRYQAFKARGPHFWPEVIVDDAKISALVLLILLALTATFGVPTEPRADPTDTDYIPRPEWYFMFLFQMLKLFPGNLEWVGAVVIPGLAITLLFLVPFLSRGQERRPTKRPLAMASLTLMFAAITFLTVQAYRTTPSSTLVEGQALTSTQLRGRQLVDQQGCQSCHIIAGEGEKKGPPLDGINERMTAADVHFFMERPKTFNPGASMTSLLPTLSHDDVEAITQYLLTLPADIALHAKGRSQ